MVFEPSEIFFQNHANREYPSYPKLSEGHKIQPLGDDGIENEDGNLKGLHEKDEPSQVGEALGDDLDYDGVVGETTSGSSIYISSIQIPSVDKEQVDTDKYTNIVNYGRPKSLSLFLELPNFRSSNVSTR